MCVRQLITVADQHGHCCHVGTLLQGASRWRVLHNARLLLGVIKLLLFFLSFVISNSVYFAAFFGPQSCFFSRTGKFLACRRTSARLCLSSTRSC